MNKNALANRYSAVCSECAEHAYPPTHKRQHTAGFDWDGGHLSPPPAQALSSSSGEHSGTGSAVDSGVDRVVVHLECKRSRIRRFHGFHDATDTRNHRWGHTFTAPEGYCSWDRTKTYFSIDGIHSGRGVGFFSQSTKAVPDELWCENGIYSYSIPENSKTGTKADDDWFWSLWWFGDGLGWKTFTNTVEGIGYTIKGIGHTVKGIGKLAEIGSSGGGASAIF